MFLKRNSSTILTCMGAVGVVATAISAAKATPKAITLVKQKEDEIEHKLTKLETVRVAAPVYIPSVMLGASTIACIFGANVLSKHAQAALTSAYALIENSYKEYRTNVNKVFGEDADHKVVQSMAEDHYEEIEVSDGKQLFFDLYSLQFFESTLDDVLNVEQYMNDTLNSRGYVSLNEFYNMLDIPPSVEQYEGATGWSMNNGHIHGYDRIIFEHEKVNMNGTDCWVVVMPVEPQPDYLL